MSFFKFAALFVAFSFAQYVDASDKTVKCDAPPMNVSLTSQQFAGTNAADGYVIVVESGKAVEVNCQRQPQPINPAGQLRWKLKKRDADAFVDVLEGFTLSLATVTAANAGLYKCEEPTGTHESDIFATFRLVVVPSGKFKVHPKSTDDDDDDDKTDDDDIKIPCLARPVSPDEYYRWTLNGAAVVAKADKYELGTEGSERGQLSVTNYNARDSGCFVCTVWANEAQADDPDAASDSFANCYQADPLAITKDHTSKNVMEGELAELECFVYGYPVPEITWFKADTYEEDDDDEDRKVLVDPVPVASYSPSKTDATDKCLYTKGNKNQHRNAKLVIQKARRGEGGDRAYYQCKASATIDDEPKVDDQGIVILRVKDQLAALWPFIGIVVEVIVLVVVILIFERRQKAKERAEEEETDQKKPLASEESDVRQRAVKT